MRLITRDLEEIEKDIYTKLEDSSVPFPRYDADIMRSVLSCRIKIEIDRVMKCLTWFNLV